MLGYTYNYPTMHGQTMPKVIKQSPNARPAPKKIVESSDNAWDMIDSLHVLLYGDSGTGKTTFWSTFPGPIKAFVCSGGSRPGELKSIDTEENREKIHAKIVRSSEQLCDELEALDGFETVIIDHASGLLSLILKEYLGLDDLPAVKKWGMANQADWGNINEKCIRILGNILDFPGNVVIVAQERVFRGKEDNVTSDIIKPAVGAALTPGVVSWLNPACDYVVQTFKRPVVEKYTTTVAGKTQNRERRGVGVEYCLRTAPHDIFTTKFRIVKGRDLPEVIIDPSYEKVVQLIKGA